MLGSVPVKESMNRVDGVGKETWKERRERRRKEQESRHGSKQDQKKLDKPSPSWTQIRWQIELCDDLELFWHEGFGDPELARRNRNPDAVVEEPRGEFTLTAELRMQLSNANGSANELPCTPINPVLIAANSMPFMTTNNSNASAGAVAEPKPASDVPMMQLQQMSYCQRVRFAEAYNRPVQD